MSLLPVLEAALIRVADSFNSIPLILLLVGHCLSCASFVDNRYGDKWTLNNLAGFTIAFGGGTLSALLLQDPARVPVIFLSGNAILLTWGLCWWAFNYSPFNIVRRLWSIRPVAALAQVGLCILRAGIMVQRVDYVLSAHPGHFIAAIFYSVVGSSGGGILVDFFNSAGGYGKGPTEVGTPGFVLRSGFFLALFHLLTVHIFSVLSSKASLGVLTTLLVTHNTAAVLLGQTWDFTALPAKLLHTVTMIPETKRRAPKPTASRPVTRSATAAGSGREEVEPSTPASSTKPRQRKSMANGKHD